MALSKKKVGQSGSDHLMSFQGIVIASDQNQEWLLSWWWSHYSKYNSYPVVIVDLGLSEKGRNWCKKEGIEILTLPETLYPEKQINCAEKRSVWENHYGEAIWRYRLIWFKKPFALQLSPFEYSLWLDLDCQVKGSLDPIFNSLFMGFDLAIKKEPVEIQKQHQEKRFLSDDEINYNGGVIGFRKNAPFLNRWIEEIQERNDQYVFDQQALSRAISKEKPPLFELPENYNWSIVHGINSEALINHFHGSVKELIRLIIA